MSIYDDINNGDHNLFALKFLLKNDDGYSSADERDEANENFVGDVAQPIDDDEAIDYASWGDETSEFYVYDPKTDSYSKYDPDSEGTGRLIFSQKGVYPNRGDQKSYFLIGKTEPGRSVLTAQDWAYGHPNMSGVQKKYSMFDDSGKLHTWVNNLAYPNDVMMFSGNYPREARSPVQKEMIRQLRMNPEIDKFLKKHKEAQNWDSIVKLLYNEGLLPEGRPSAVMPSRVAAEADFDPENISDDFIYDKLVDAIYSTAVDLQRRFRREEAIAKEAQRADDAFMRNDRVNDVLAMQRGRSKEDIDYLRKRARERALQNKAGKPNAVLSWVRVNPFDLVKLNDILTGSVSGNLNSGNELMANQFVIGDEKGQVPLELILNRKAGPVTDYYTDRKRGARGRDAFGERFRVDPDRVPSDAEIKETARGLVEGIEPLLKQRRIVEGVLRRF